MVVRPCRSDGDAEGATRGGTLAVSVTRSQMRKVGEAAREAASPTHQVYSFWYSSTLWNHASQTRDRPDWDTAIHIVSDIASDGWMVFIHSCMRRVRQASERVHDGSQSSVAHADTHSGTHPAQPFQLHLDDHGEG